MVEESHASAIGEIAHFQLLEKIGDGSHGDVYHAFNIQTQKETCVKVSKNNIDSTIWSFNQEIVVGKSVEHHDNIVKMIDYGEGLLTLTDQQILRKVIWIETPFCNGGDLFDKVLESKAGLDEDEARTLFRQVIDAVSHFHEAGFAHRDIKLENVFVDNDKNGKSSVLLADPGLAEYFKGQNSRKLHKQVGTMGYMAPELFKRKTLYYEGPPVDVFSCGILLYTMLNGCPVFDHTDGRKSPVQLDEYRSFMASISKCKERRNLSANIAALDLIQKMILPDPAERFTLEEVREHPWFE